MKKQNPSSRVQRTGTTSVFSREAGGKVKVLETRVIENPGQYLERDWWRSYFDHLFFLNYLNITTPEITQKEVKDVREALNLHQEHKILDLACGTGRHLIELARQGFKYLYGVDLSEHMLEGGIQDQDRYNLNLTLKKADVRETGFSDNYFDKAIMMGNSLGYFENEEEDYRVIAEAYRVLKPGGHFLIDNADGDFISKNYNPTFWRWMANGYFVCYEKKLIDKRMVTREIIVNPEVGVVADQVSSVRLYSRKELMDAFKKAGFQNVTIHGSLTLSAQEVGEAGGMSHRILISGQKK